jgi:4a-hydroxytetrahydrobiopterin dehydratase
MILLGEEAIAKLLTRLPGWQHESGALVKTFHFASFSGAMSFMYRCAPEIDRLGHHPEWRNVYDRVDVRLTTHDAGGKITARDGELAELLEARAREAGAR